MKNGDTIKCKDENDMIETMMELATSGVITDWKWIAEESERKYTLVVTEVVDR